MTGEELYSKGIEKMRLFYDTASYCSCGGMHSTDYNK